MLASGHCARLVGGASTVGAQFYGEKVSSSTCRGCGAVVIGRTKRAFCSNACQMADRQRRLIEAWLATGEGQVNSDRLHYMRIYLRSEQNDSCAVCGQPSIWNGRPLVLVLDHVDGDAANNARDNLRMVCPNCDSQLPTYKNRNKGKGRFARRERYANGQSY